MKKLYEKLYFAGKSIFVAGVAFFILWSGIKNAFPVALSKIRLPMCGWYKVTGIYCPGCGGTRAVFFLSKLQFVKSFICHPFVLYLLLVYILFMTTFFIKKHFPSSKIKVISLEKCMYIGILIILAQWVVKNILVLVFNIAIL